MYSRMDYIPMSTCLYRISKLSGSREQGRNNLKGSTELKGEMTYLVFTDQ